MQQKYAFLDRDGALIYEPPDDFQIDSLEKLFILPGVISGLKKLTSNGYKLVLISNQDGLGTNSFPKENFKTPQKEMLKIFAENDITFDQIFICPHFPEDNCECRKPKIGMVEKFLSENNIDKNNSFMYGDRESDRKFAKNIGIPFYKVITNGQFNIKN